MFVAGERETGTIPKKTKLQLAEKETILATGKEKELLNRILSTPFFFVNGTSNRIRFIDKIDDKINDNMTDKIDLNKKIIELIRSSRYITITELTKDF